MSKLRSLPPPSEAFAQSAYGKQLMQCEPFSSARLIWNLQLDPYVFICLAVTCQLGGGKCNVAWQV